MADGRCPGSLPHGVVYDTTPAILMGHRVEVAGMSLMICKRPIEHSNVLEEREKQLVY
jgi:hypothetical protein